MSFASLIGQVIDGKYKIESQLGKGGMGTVYLATHVGTERPVAVKVIVQQFMERPEFVERFRREARAAGRLRHPNVVNVTDFGIAETMGGRTAYLVMEYLDGCTLGEILDEERQLPLSWSLDIIHQVCSAIHEAHGQGIIHRDLKPDNIWLEPNQRGGYSVKVLDFGIAKLEEGHQELPEGDIHISGLPTEAVERLNTVADRSGTIVEGAGTVVSEAGTLVIEPESGTRASDNGDEKGTMIMAPAEDFSEGGTAILDNDGTKLMNPSSESSNSVSRELDGASASGTVELTRVGAVLGTPLYMSPEQCRGERLSAKSDIYSLGIITYQMLSGRTPFEGDFTDVMNAHKEIEPPRLEGRKIPRRVRKVVHAALSKNPDERPQDAQAFAARLQASSDGIGALLIRAMTIFAERLPTILAIAFLISIPSLVLSLLRGSVKFASGIEYIKPSTGVFLLESFLQLTTFFAQVFTTALLIGIITWMIAQILAVPLRPIDMRMAIRSVRDRWKPLVKTVTATTFISVLGWIVAMIPAGIVAAVFGAIFYFIAGNTAASIVGGGVFIIALFFVGVAITAFFSLVAPVIMMEGKKGRAALRRSYQLTRRSFGTVFAASTLNYFVPMILGIAITAVVAGLVSKNDVRTDPSSPAAATAEQKPAEKKGEGLQISVNGPGGLEITDQNAPPDPEREAKMMRRELTTGIFELLWAPIVILISSFTAIVTALIYFKTRQAGGESMQDLLEQFEDDKPKTRWQQRVQRRLIQSGRVTSKP